FILSGERAEEFQPETITRTIANYACDLCVTWSQELDLHQLIWLQVNSGVERPTAVAYFGPAPRHQHARYPIAENNVNREIDFMPLPTPRIHLGGHLCLTYLTDSASRPNLAAGAGPQQLDKYLTCVGRARTVGSCGHHNLSQRVNVEDVEGAAQSCEGNCSHHHF